MKRVHKIGLISAGLLGMALVASSCTGNFCTVTDKSRILFAVEPGVSTYYDSEAEADTALASISNKKSFKQKVEGTTDVWRVVARDSDDNFMMHDKSAGKYVTLTQLKTIIESAASSGAYRPSDDYFAAMDQKVLVKAYEQANKKLADAKKSEIEDCVIKNNVITTFDGLISDFDDKTMLPKYRVINSLPFLPAAKSQIDERCSDYD